MNPSLYFRYMVRESRGSWGRLAFFTACLSVGVAAVVAVAGLSDSLDQGIRAEARKLLAADLAVQGRRPFPPGLEARLEEVAGVRKTRIKEMPTVVSTPSLGEAPGRSQLVELKMVEGLYPYYGELIMEPALPLHRLLSAESTVVGPELLSWLGLEIGDSLRIGEAEFTIAGRVDAEPDRIRIALTLGPRVFLSAKGLERAGLEKFGSRIRHQLLIRLPDGTSRGALEELASDLRDELAETGYYQVETYAEAQPALRRGFKRLEKFLGLVALLSLLVGGIGVAQAIQAWLSGRMDAIAVLKSLGVRSREIVFLYLGQTALLGLLGSVLGVGGGLMAQMVMPSLLGDLLPVTDLRVWQPWAVLRGLALGVGVAALFALPPLLGIRGVPPARVLRRDAEPLPTPRRLQWGAWFLLVVGIALLASVQTESIRQGLQFAAGMLVASAVLSGAALLLMRGAARLPRNFSKVWVRHGLSALQRSGAGTLGAVLALGLGVVVVLAMYLVQSRLQDQFQEELPRDVPTAFLIDIQPDQWDPVQELLQREGAEKIDSVPVVMARLRSVDGRPVQDLLDSGDPTDRRRWVLTREQRLTYLEELPADNKVVEGELWAQQDQAEISVEKGFAEDMGAELGSRVVFDIQGVPLTLTVTSIRKVDWETFRINFFLIVEPGVLDDAPQSRLATVRLPHGTEQQVQDRLAESFSNVTFLKIREILEKVWRVLDRLGLGIRILGGFTVLAGIVILAGVVSSGTVKRAREVALLKTLGMTRGGVVSMFAVEYALVGLVAGGIGSVGGGVLGWLVLTRGLEVTWKFQMEAQVAAILLCVVLTVVAGILTSAPALARRPVEVLREE